MDSLAAAVVQPEDSTPVWKPSIKMSAKKKSAKKKRQAAKERQELDQET